MNEIHTTNTSDLEISKRDIKKGARLAGRIISGLKRGRTDFHIREGKIDFRNTHGQPTETEDPVYLTTKTLLSTLGVEIDAYYAVSGGFDMGEDRIAIVSVNSVPIPASRSYDLELSLRAPRAE